MEIRKCRKCGRYTLKESCPLCGEKTFNPHPPKFSLNDKYLELRVKAEKK